MAKAAGAGNRDVSAAGPLFRKEQRAGGFPQPLTGEGREMMRSLAGKAFAFVTALLLAAPA